MKQTKPKDKGCPGKQLPVAFVRWFINRFEVPAIRHAHNDEDWRKKIAEALDFEVVPEFRAAATSLGDKLNDEEV